MPVPSMPLTPLSRLCALFEEVAGDAIARAVGEGGCVFRTRGIIGDWTQKKTFWNNVYYGVDLSEGGRVISVDLPYEVIQSGDIRPGSLVDVIGTPSVHLKKSVVLFKLHIHAACVITPPASAAPRYEAGRQSPQGNRLSPHRLSQTGGRGFGHPFQISQRQCLCRFQQRAGREERPP